MSTAVVIVAAGRGSRAGGPDEAPKQYRLLAGRPVIRYSIETFSRHDRIGCLQPVVHAEDRALFAAAVAAVDGKLAPPVAGGATRQASVLAGLEALVPRKPECVLIHDAARPFVTPSDIDAVLDGLAAAAGAIVALPVADTLKRGGAGRRIVATLDRSDLWSALTPQGFRFDAILAAHRKARDAGRDDFTDDAAIAEWAGLDVTLVTGTPDNIKLTTAADFQMGERIAADRCQTLEPRTGSGFDVHRFTTGDHVWLCGVRIPHENGLEGHSDADAPLHALTDAILGALGDGDIGLHFPPSDPRWKGAPSRLFVADAAARVAGRCGRIVNVDVTILCEAPRIGPYRAAMVASIAGILGIGPDRVGVKATTTERLGFTGRGEGLAAMATATVLLPAGRTPPAKAEGS